MLESCTGSLWKLGPHLHGSFFRTLGQQNITIGTNVTFGSSGSGGGGS
jgi:hypothetical protein